MITIFVIGILIFVFKMIGLAMRAAWGITKGLLVIVIFPMLLVGLFLAGITAVAVPVLIIVCLAAMLSPVLNE